ncbi:MAG: nitroreductase [Eudoraea sp.]|nr:nitroreductase [Eudoraea sp.]
MIFELIEKRRAVFPAQFNDRPIADKDIKTLLSAANWAPTHKRTEPWRFKVIKGKAKARLGDFIANTYEKTTPNPKQLKIKKLKEKTQQSAAIIAICMQRDPEERIPEWEEIASTAMAVQNIWLGCTELGIGCYWSSPSLIKYMDDFFQLKEGERCLGFLYMGYYDVLIEEGQRGRFEEKVTWISN